MDRCDLCSINRFLHVYNRKNSGQLKVYKLIFNLCIQYNI